MDPFFPAIILVALAVAYFMSKLSPTRGLRVPDVREPGLQHLGLDHQLQLHPVGERQFEELLPAGDPPERDGLDAQRRIRQHAVPAPWLLVECSRPAFMAQPVFDRRHLFEAVPAGTAAGLTRCGRR
jgi:hypothetical protein